MCIRDRCWRLASYLHMAKLIVRNALLVVAVGRPRGAPPRLRQRNAVHGRRSTFFTNFLHVVLLLLLL